MKKLLDIANEIMFRDRNARAAKLADAAQAELLAMAKDLVLRGKKGCVKEGSTHGWLRGCVDRVREGGWEPAEGTPWTCDFVHGLRLSGALRRHNRAGSFYVPFPDRRRWLVDEARAGLPVSCRGVRDVPAASGFPGVFLHGFYMGEMPPTDPSGPGVLAGMLAGSVKVRKADGLWLAMRRSDEAEWVLDRWTVAYRVGKGFTKWNNVLLTSPFYAGVMRRRMPERAKEWVGCSVRPAWCPLLPMAMWQMCFRGEGGSWGMPFPGALPWGRGRREAARMGLGLKGLRRAALDVCGVTGVYGGLRDEMLAGYELAKADPRSRLVL